ncbi:MAG: L-threonylcarbamoyladenylate synthase [Christensenellaceae bacterium]|jgi:L-threonylcarbamoyladenylate synthase
MNTKVIYAHKKENIETAVQEGAALLRAGEAVVFPTETVYGLGANAFSGDAVQKIFIAKGRPQDNPLIVHIAKKEQLYEIAESVPEAAQKLVEAFWPGPLSIILKRGGAVAKSVSAGLDTVAVRMPANEIALRLIMEAGLPVAAPSANVSGRPSPTSAAHAYEDLCGKVPLIIDGGPCGVGIESTVVDLTKNVPAILRPGAVTQTMLADVLGEVRLHESLAQNMDASGKVASPGMKYKHYSPRAEVKLFAGEQKEVEKNIKSMYDFDDSLGQRDVIMCSSGCARLYGSRNILLLGTGAHEIGTVLFASLRKADELGYSRILFHAEDSMGLAVLNRIAKAAGEVQ